MPKTEVNAQNLVRVATPSPTGIPPPAFAMTAASIWTKRQPNGCFALLPQRQLLDAGIADVEEDNTMLYERRKLLLTSA